MRTRRQNNNSDQQIKAGRCNVATNVGSDNMILKFTRLSYDSKMLYNIHSTRMIYDIRNIMCGFEEKLGF